MLFCVPHPGRHPLGGARHRQPGGRRHGTGLPYDHRRERPDPLQHVWVNHDHGLLDVTLHPEADQSAADDTARAQRAAVRAHGSQAPPTGETQTNSGMLGRIREGWAPCGALLTPSGIPKLNAEDIGIHGPFDYALVSHVTATSCESARPGRKGMEVKLDTFEPHGVTRLVPREDLRSVYSGLTSDQSATLTWNDGGDQVLIVAVGDDYSIVTMLNNSTWHFLQISPDEELVQVSLTDEESLVPKGAILPKALGLEVLEKAEDFPALLREYSWREQ